jgi:hypothetical protein
MNSRRLVLYLSGGLIVVAIVWWWAGQRQTAVPASTTGGGSSQAQRTTGRPSDSIPIPLVTGTAARPRQATPPADAPVTAQVMVGEKRYVVQADGEGVFVPRVPTAIGARPAVRVAFPDGEPGEPVVVQVEDGGVLENNEPTKLAHLDERRQMEFALQMTRNPGLFRVVLRKGAETRTLQFWAGPPLPVAQN